MFTSTSRRRLLLHHVEQRRGVVEIDARKEPAPGECGECNPFSRARGSGSRLRFERLKAPTEDVRLGGAEAIGEAIEAFPVRWLEVNLDRLGDPWLVFLFIMLMLHEFMIQFYHRPGKPEWGYRLPLHPRTQIGEPVLDKNRTEHARRTAG